MFVCLKQNPTSLVGVWMHVCREEPSPTWILISILLLGKDSKPPSRFLGWGSYPRALSPSMVPGIRAITHQAVLPCLLSDETTVTLGLNKIS